MSVSLTEDTDVLLLRALVNNTRRNSATQRKTNSEVLTEKFIPTVYNVVESAKTQQTFLMSTPPPSSVLKASQARSK
jgi:hypothetical protein